MTTLGDIEKSTPKDTRVSPLRAEIFNFIYHHPNIKPSCIGSAAVSEYTQASSSSPYMTTLGDIEKSTPKDTGVSHLGF